MLQQVIDGVDVRVGQPKAQDVGLGSSWAGQSGPLGLTPQARGASSLMTVVRGGAISLSTRVSSPLRGRSSSLGQRPARDSVSYPRASEEQTGSVCFAFNFFKGRGWSF